MIIDSTYFILKVNLPQVGTTDGLADINQFIAQYEPEYLQKVLGYDLWKAFTEGIAGSGEPDARWLSLLEGAEFTYQSRNYKWPGFEAKPSPISQYIYYMHQEDGALDTVLAGTSTGNTENATRVAPAPKMIDAWNKMVELNILLWNFLYANKETYPEWKHGGYYPQWYWPQYFSYGYCHKNEMFNLKNSHDL